MKANKKAKFDLPYEMMRLCKREGFSKHETALMVGFAKRPVAERVEICKRAFAAN